MLRALQAAVEASKTDHQRKTETHERSLFLGTEAGEAMKEVLKLFGSYGKGAVEGSKERLAKELCDVIWNACDLATLVGIDLDEPMRGMLEENRKRVWVDEAGNSV